MLIAAISPFWPFEVAVITICHPCSEICHPCSAICHLCSEIEPFRLVWEWSQTGRKLSQKACVLSQTG